MKLKTAIPWQAKIAAKIFLSRIPLGYTFWKKLRLFEHGQMEKPIYAYSVFKTHYDRVKPIIGDSTFVALELGPGDTLFSALVARAFGATRCYLVDSGSYADLRPYAYAGMAGELARNGHKLPAPPMDEAIEPYLENIGTRYLVNGLASLKQIPSRSVDFIWSQAVLEHIKRNEFDSTLHELRRIMRDDGAASHRIDLADHLGGSLNNLRFSRTFWESKLMATSGFYTNRIRYAEMVEVFVSAGFDVEVQNVDRWPRLPTPREKLSEEFRRLDDEDLLVSGFDVLLLPRNS